MSLINDFKREFCPNLYKLECVKNTIENNDITKCMPRFNEYTPLGYVKDQYLILRKTYIEICKFLEVKPKKSKLKEFDNKIKSLLIKEDN